MKVGDLFAAQSLYIDIYRNISKAFKRNVLNIINYIRTKDN